ncbi:transcriptional regulator, GntR family [Psychromonas ingrahamii 37]|uniref:Transcriptional regulator, GntR family n=1 Tax=Psychromonas ingrahamii (strain DSM 17664 / CCUG 51855 / 37) TaxID=357804 RepID=A1T0T4_PSYIN|nr:GntR family transcriptional regulator [Psychromonas ingrahamii]ABM05349.1 transcriptional regulator, GntR family [Psychromonas ingrahamii 37]
MTRAADKLISQITQDITSGVLQPGDQLKESFLAEKFGVSRTPIREAIRAMVRLGLLEAIPRKGVKVRILNTKELLDLFEVAAGLEGMASRLAAYSLTDEHAKVILSKLENCKVAAENEDKVQYSIANIEFHAAIHEATNNRWLIEQLQHIGIHINTYRSLPYNVRERLSKSTEEHEAICKAILAGEGSTASQLMRDHMMLQGQRLPSVLKFFTK